MASHLPPISFTKEATNYARLCRLLIEVGSQVLREKFNDIHDPANLHVILHSFMPKLKSLRSRRILSQAQWDSMNPAVHATVSSENFDISTLCVLLINICNLSPPATGWRQTPSSSNGSLCWGRHFENEAFQKFLVCACHEDIHWWSQLQQLLEWQSRCVGEISRGEVWRPDEKNENWVHGSWCWRRLQKPFKRKAKIKWWH